MKTRHVESQHQQALMKWARALRLNAAGHIEDGAALADYLIAIPNGGRRGKQEAAIMKSEGVKAGVSDLLLALPLHGWPGLWIEMKKPFTCSADKNYPTAEQRAWQSRMSLAGYLAEVCYGWDEAKAVIEQYLAGRFDKFGVAA